MDSSQPVVVDSDDKSPISENGSNGKFYFPTAMMFGKRKGSGVAVHLPVSATDFLLRVINSLSSSACQ